MGCGPSHELGEKQGLKLKQQRKASRYENWKDHPELKQFEILKPLGHGGFSEVHLGRHMLSGQLVAIKVVAVGQHAGTTAEEEETLENEARMLPLLDHPHIARCYKVVATRRHVVMFLEFCGGGALLSTLAKLPNFGEGLVACLFAQLMRAIQYCHALGIAHRDIKPENIMFSGNDAVADTLDGCGTSTAKVPHLKLIDFGLASVLQAPEAGKGKGGVKLKVKVMEGIVGSPGYIAPEIICGKHHTTAMDIWSCGSLLFTLLAGRQLFSKLDTKSLFYGKKSINDAPGLLDPHFTELSKPAKELILWMCSDDTAARPSAARVLEHPFITGACGATMGQQNTAAIRARFKQIEAMRHHHGLAFAMHLQKRGSLTRGAKQQQHEHDTEWLHKQVQLHHTKCARRYQAQSAALGLPSLMTTSVMQDLATDNSPHDNAYASPHATDADAHRQGLAAGQHAPCRVCPDGEVHMQSLTVTGTGSSSYPGTRPGTASGMAPAANDATVQTQHAAGLGLGVRSPFAAAADIGHNSAGTVNAHASSSGLRQEGVCANGISVAVDDMSHMQDGHEQDAGRMHGAPPKQQAHAQQHRKGPSADAHAALSHIVPEFARADTLPVPVMSPTGQRIQKKALLPRAMSVEPLADMLNDPAMHDLVGGSSNGTSGSNVALDMAGLNALGKEHSLAK